MEYKQTLNLPQTAFPIRANLQKIEADLLAHWENLDLYQQIQAKNKTAAKKFVLHDGPPYPNGDIHLGHALNKIIKDIIIKYKSMQGFASPYIPGWDCHGLPIETQLIKQLTDEERKKYKEPNKKVEFRNRCKEYALKYVDLQRQEFKRLGALGDWENPYLTIDPLYEADIIRLFGDLAEKGYVYRGLKPIHWCPHCETALAEAELEYEEDKSPSIYVKFEIRNPKSEINSKIKNPNLPTDLPWFFVVWTTTPWTLPANMAIAAHAEYEYVFINVKCQMTNDKYRNEIYIVAEGLLEDFVKRVGITDYQIIDKTKGEYLEGVVAKHPFIDCDVMLVLDEYVTLEQGTGLVHIAPGHGIEDYKVGLKYKLFPIVMPVTADGRFDETVPEFIRGEFYKKANDLIIEQLKNGGSFLRLENIKHSFPHCWRCKNPVIFRATEQWFVSVDHLGMREKALKAIIDTKWYPAWGENRIRGMVETRPDWCISRQRTWGVPIPVFYCDKCHQPSMTGIFNESIRKIVLERGTNGWFDLSAKEILPSGTKCSKCDGDSFTKETDILDVWFESGSSHALLERLPDHHWPADLYLEGSDQHRGWFQSSLLIAVGYKGRAPFNSVLTHGFTIDDKGKKMSKSLGNVIGPQEVVKEYGADVLRLWVASTDFRNDMAASKNILVQVREAYSKIRNTCRFLISNLYDFTPSSDVRRSLPLEKGENERGLLELDRWILLRLNRLIERIIQSYDEYELHVVYHALYEFCVNDLSAHYLDMSKDRLYCDGKSSPERRSAQFAMWEILFALVGMMAPVLSFTAEDIGRHMAAMTNDKCLMPNEGSIFLSNFPKIKEEYLDKELEARWEKIMVLRAEVYKVLEEKRANKIISASIEAVVEIGLQGREWLKAVDPKILPMVLIVSQVKLVDGDKIAVSKASDQKCGRCWMLLPTVGKSHQHPDLCERCEKVVRELTG
ncbi:isoleucine--tRNA ligase [Candidatus Saganbacteria bacterium]|nr:isoleucine--tRNA ligase [Candidatus Saganbacteria bacterium]